MLEWEKVTSGSHRFGGAELRLGKTVESADDLHRLLTSRLVGKPTALTTLRLEKKVFVNIVPKELNQTRANFSMRGVYRDVWGRSTQRSSFTLDRISRRCLRRIRSRKHTPASWAVSLTTAFPKAVR